MRAFGEAALSTLHKSGASSSGHPPTRRNIERETADAFAALVTLLPNKLLVISSATPNGPHTASSPLLAKSLEFQASLVADIVHTRNFTQKEIWDRCVALYAGPWLGEEDGLKFAETVCSHFRAIDQVFLLHLMIRSNLALIRLYRLNTLQLSKTSTKKASCFATLYSRWPMVLFFSFPIQHSDSSVAVGTEYWEPMAQENQL